MNPAAAPPRQAPAVSYRDQVLAAVRRYPGIHGRQMERHLGLSSKLASYHLQRLEEEGAVQRVEETGFTRFFPALGKPKWNRADIQFLSLLRRPVALRIVVLLASQPRASRRELAKRLGLALASVSHHLDLLQGAGIVTSEADGRARAYMLADAAATMGRLANFTPLPEDLEPFDRLWNDLFG